MTVEILFPEICSIYGDNGNIEYLKHSLPDAVFIETAFTDTPCFADNTPDFIYIGSMSEATQRDVIAKLMPLRDRLISLADSGTVILATGNSADIFCTEIDFVTEEIKTKALGIFDLSVRTDFFDRWNGKVLGEFEGMKIVGFRSQFSQIFGDNSKFAFMKVERGGGINRDSKFEGMRRGNLICTGMVGPVLPLNPPLCEYLFALAGAGDSKAAFGDVAMDAYNARLKEFTDPETVFGYNK